MNPSFRPSSLGRRSGARPQFGVLLAGQTQKHSAAAGLDRRIESLAADEIGQGDHFIRGSEIENPGQGSGQIGLQELASPASAELKTHVDAMAGVGQACIIGEQMENI